MQAIAQQLPANDIFALADRLRTLRISKKNTEDQLKDINNEIAHVEENLARLMVDEEMQNFTRSGQMFYLKNELYASAVPERKQELYQWLKDNGFGDMVQETVNGNTLRAWVKEQLEESEDDELPEGLRELINVYPRQTVGMRKAGK